MKKFLFVIFCFLSFHVFAEELTSFMGIKLGSSVEEAEKILFENGWKISTKTEYDKKKKKWVDTDVVREDKKSYDWYYAKKNDIITENRFAAEIFWREYIGGIYAGQPCGKLRLCFIRGEDDFHLYEIHVHTGDISDLWAALVKKYSFVESEYYDEKRDIEQNEIEYKTASIFGIRFEYKRHFIKLAFDRNGSYISVAEPLERNNVLIFCFKPIVDIPIKKATRESQNRIDNLLNENL